LCQALTERASISFQRSRGSKPLSCMRAIMICIIPDIILGMALVATATKSPPATAPNTAASTYLRLS